MPKNQQQELSEPCHDFFITLIENNCRHLSVNSASHAYRMTHRQEERERENVFHPTEQEHSEFDYLPLQRKKKSFDLPANDFSESPRKDFQGIKYHRWERDGRPNYKVDFKGSRWKRRGNTPRRSVVALFAVSEQQSRRILHGKKFMDYEGSSRGFRRVSRYLSLDGVISER